MRLTNKVDLDRNKPSYCEPAHLEEYTTKNKHLAINILGQLEDILEKYHIEDAQQLDNVLSMHKRTCENLMKMTHKWEKERRNGKMLELLKSHIIYCQNDDCFVFTSIDDPVAKKRMEKWLLWNILD